MFETLLEGNTAEALKPVLDFFNNFVLPALLLIWKEIRDMRKSFGTMRERMVRIETTLKLPTHPHSE
jgi:hypothetical protein